jgi:hypothetical protein
MIAVAAALLGAIHAPSAAAAKADAALNDAQFCAFARGIEQSTRPSKAPVAHGENRIAAVRANCAARQVTWLEAAERALAAREVAGMNANWNRFMCGTWPFRDAVLRGWKLSKRVSAGGRSYEATARCRPG